MSQLNGSGHFVSWDGGCMLIGHGGGLVPEHSHYAIQVAFGDEPGIRFRGGARDEWTTYDGAVISSRQPHEMDATAVRRNAVIFVEPETREGRALRARWLGEGGIVALPDEVLAPVRGALFDAWGTQGRQAVTDASQAVVHALTGGVPTASSDERILRATAYIRANLDRPLTLEEVAAEACLSPSRFRHLFVEETGMALRPYILWRRFLQVWEHLMRGATLSAAAHAAGFADAAHLSRTSRRMFGLPPSALQMLGPLRDEAAAAPPNAYPAPGQPLRSRS